MFFMYLNSWKGNQKNDISWLTEIIWNLNSSFHKYLLEPSHTHIFITLFKEKLNMRDILHGSQKFLKKLPSNPLSSPTSGLYSSNFSPFENNPLMISSWIIFLLFWLLAWDKLPEVSVSQWLWALWWPLDVKPDYSPQELYQFPPANEGVWGYQFPLIWYPISWHPMMTSYLNLEMTLSWVPTS